MQTPLILTNFKTYQTATGQNALALARLHAEAAEKTGVAFAVAVQTIDIPTIVANVDIPVFAQHCDAVGFGSYTGWIMPEALKQAGVTGTILNHSEHRFADHESLGNAIDAARKAGLVICVCAETAKEGAILSEKFAPDFIAVEPPELIGGDISVSTARPALISDAVSAISASAVLVGAGVKNGADVAKAIELGAKGVLLASGITKAADPLTVLLNLASGAK